MELNISLNKSNEIDVSRFHVMRYSNLHSAEEIKTK